MLSHAGQAIALVVLLTAGAASMPARAADGPDLIFKQSTKWRALVRPSLTDELLG